VAGNGGKGIIERGRGRDRGKGRVGEGKGRWGGEMRQGEGLGKGRGHGNGGAITLLTIHQCWQVWYKFMISDNMLSHFSSEQICVTYNSPTERHQLLVCYGSL